MTATIAPDAAVLVAGGAGFLGSHLCERLVRDGYRVLCVDNLVTGEIRNIKSLLDRGPFSFMHHDISEPLHVGNVARICNLACPASPVHYQADPVRTTVTSVHGTRNLLELARVSGSTFLQASTSEVYGDPTVHPQSESYWGYVNPAGVRSCYDEGKRCAETLCFDYQRTRDVQVKVARIFNTYGPRMQIHDGRVVSNLIVQALRGEPLTIYGNGAQTRSFCYVDDLIEGLVRLIHTSDAVSGPMNLGNPEEFTILELAELVLDLTGSRSRICFKPLPSDDPRQRCPDIELARRETGWQPRVRLRDGLVPTIAWFEALLSKLASRRRCRELRPSAAAAANVQPSTARVSHARQ